MSEPAPSARRLALALAPGTLLAGVAGGIVFPIFPIVGLKVGLSLGFIGMILAANRALRVVSAPLVGALADRIGGRRTLLLGLAVQIVVIAMYILGLVIHQEGLMFLLGRMLHGPGSACVFIAAQSLALEAGGAGKGGATAGTVRATMVVGVPIGFAMGGLLSDAIGVVLTFTVAAGSVIAALIAAYITVPDLRAKISRKPPLGETLRAMSDRRLLGVGAMNFALNFAAGGMVLSTLALLVHSRGLHVLDRGDQATAGLLMGLMSVLDGGATPFAGYIGDRWRAHARVATVACVLLAVGLAIVGKSDSTAGVALGIGFVGLGAAGLGPSLLVIMGAIVPPARRGVGTGLLQLCGDLGGMGGPLVGTALFAGDTQIPYLGTAALVMCVIPIGLWLSRIERAGLPAREAPPNGGAV